MYIWIWRHLPGALALQAAADAAARRRGQSRCCCSWCSRGSSRTCRSTTSTVPAVSDDARSSSSTTTTASSTTWCSTSASSAPSAIVRRNDAVRRGRPRRLDVDGVLISPGPGHAAGRRRLDGHRRGLRRARRCRCSACASATRRSARCSARRSCRAPELLHGKTSEVVARRHRACSPGCRRRSPPPATTRWPSRTPLPAEIEVTGRTASGVVMALRHRSLPIEGVQFHPESVLTQGGHRMVANWLRRCGAGSTTIWSASSATAWTHSGRAPSSPANRRPHDRSRSAVAYRPERHFDQAKAYCSRSAKRRGPRPGGRRAKPGQPAGPRAGRPGAGRTGASSTTQVGARPRREPPDVVAAQRPARRRAVAAQTASAGVIRISRTASAMQNGIDV